MRPTLRDIDKAIHANFVLNPDGGKYLETDDRIERHFKGAARIVFVGVAVENGFQHEGICEHLQMTVKEFNGKLSQFRERLQSGRAKNSRRKQENRYDQEEALDFDLRIYRKYILIRNCIERLKEKRLILF